MATVQKTVYRRSGDQKEGLRRQTFLPIRDGIRLEVVHPPTSVRLMGDSKQLRI